MVFTEKRFQYPERLLEILYRLVVVAHGNVSSTGVVTVRHIWMPISKDIPPYLQCLCVDWK